MNTERQGECLSQYLKLKRFRSFSGKCFRFFSGVFPAFFRNKSGKTPEKKLKHFPEKERNLLSFKARTGGAYLHTYLIIGLVGPMYIRIL